MKVDTEKVNTVNNNGNIKRNHDLFKIYYGIFNQGIDGINLWEIVDIDVNNTVDTKIMFTVFDSKVIYLIFFKTDNVHFCHTKEFLLLLITVIEYVKMDWDSNTMTYFDVVYICDFDFFYMFDNSQLNTSNCLKYD